MNEPTPEQRNDSELNSGELQPTYQYGGHLSAFQLWTQLEASQKRVEEAERLLRDIDKTAISEDNVNATSKLLVIHLAIAAMRLTEPKSEEKHD